MAKFDTIQSSFLGGELSPRALGRVDLDIYKEGCSQLLNFLVKPHGGVSRRGGTKFIKEVKVSADTTILQDFSYEDEHNFILEFGDNYIRFYKDQAQIVNAYAAWLTSTSYVIGDLVTESGSYYRCLISHTSGTFATDLAANKWVASGGATDLAYEIVTTYSKTEVSALRFTNDENTCYITHKSHPPAKLTRTTDTSWVLTDLNFITFSIFPTVAGTGYVIGEVLTVTQSGASGGTLEVSAINAAGGVTRLKTVTQGTLYKMATGLATTASASGVNCTVECSSDAHPPEWESGNYPSLVWFFERRLMFAATTNEPNGVWGSQSGDFFNFELGTGLDNEGLSIIVKQAVKFVWARGEDSVVLGATNGEFLIVASNADEALTPGNIRPLRATAYGCADIPSVSVDGSSAFLQRGKRKIRRLQYDLSRNQYVADELSLLSEHITSTGIVDIAYVNEPDPFIWFLRTDGALAGVTYDPSNDIYAWHKHTLGGVDTAVASIASTNGETPGQDELWMIVSRTVDGSTVQYVEVLTQGLLDDKDQEEAFFVDSGVTATGSSLTEVTTLDHLEGETVCILADGAVQPDVVVASGTVTIDPVADTVQVGLPFSSTLDTLPLEDWAKSSATGTNQGKMKQIESFVLRLHRSLGFTFGVPDGTLDTYYFGPPDLMDQAIPLFTGDTEKTPFPGTVDVQALVRLEQTDPLPLNILAIILKATATS